jgi:hypothetical protein
MSITIQVDLPESLLKEAKASGLLESQSVTDLISAELRRRKAAGELNQVLGKIRAVPGEPMSADEIAAQVDAVRKAKRAREAGR